MLKSYLLDGGRLREVESGGNVVLAVSPTSDEKAAIIRDHLIDEHNLTSTQDPHELPRIELEENHLVVIFKQPKRYEGRDNFSFKINAVGLFLYTDKLVVVTTDDFPPFEGKGYTKLPNLQALFLRILHSAIGHFMSHLQVIDEIAQSLETKLVQSMENKTLLQMFSIEKSLVYYVNAISANGRVIERLKANARNPAALGLSTEMMDYVDDLVIENAQCLEQAQVYANVFTGLMDARASVVSNNLNAMMKRLTVISVICMPLSVLVGMGGMSEFSMMTDHLPWPAAYGCFSFLLCLLAAGMYFGLRYLERRHWR